MISRGGRLPKIQPRDAAEPYRHRGTLHVLARDLEASRPQLGALQPLSRRLLNELHMDRWHSSEYDVDVVERFAADLREAEVGGASWRPLADSAVTLFETFWACFTDEEKECFLRDCNSLWHSLVHAMPFQTAARLQPLLSSGRIEVTHFDNVKPSPAGFTVLVGNREILSQYLVEATGLEVNVPCIKSPLIHCLLLNGMLEAHPASGFSVDQYSLESKRTPGLYVIGSLTTGVHFYTNGIDCNARHALQIKRHLASKPCQRPAHCAIILSMASHCQRGLLETAMPELPRNDIIPFLFLLVELNPSSEASDRTKHDNEQQRSMSRTLATLQEGGFTLTATSDINDLSSILEKTHIDIGVLFADRESTRRLCWTALDQSFSRCTIPHRLGVQIFLPRNLRRPDVGALSRRLLATLERKRDLHSYYILRPTPTSFAFIVAAVVHRTMAGDSTSNEAAEVVRQLFPDQHLAAPVDVELEPLLNHMKREIRSVVRNIPQIQHHSPGPWNRRFVAALRFTIDTLFNGCTSNDLGRLTVNQIAMNIQQNQPVQDDQDMEEVAFSIYQHLTIASLGLITVLFCWHGTSPPRYALIRSFIQRIGAVPRTRAETARPGNLLYSRSLKLYSLLNVGRLRVRWTPYLGEHLALDVATRTLYLFQYPSVCVLALCESQPRYKRLIQQ
ncbi:hypothetical protein BDV96DRAFT_595430 [Lophiotrema nucula]|uniref:Uncharacterized protein n=1 Tax=Lophiotrema nucula TaxID=690887 RepID=A0A6A5ZLU3_9PLEO|nr:hypothetical protein BDV96DRAFT_595430 [Lophiotrema nucula]